MAVKLTNAQIEAIGRMASKPTKVPTGKAVTPPRAPEGGPLAQVGPGNQASASTAVGFGAQPGDPPWLVRTPSDPGGWASIAAHSAGPAAAPAAAQAPASGGAPDLGWLGGAAWADPLFWQQIAQNVQTAGNNDLGTIANRNAGLTNLGYNFTFDPNDPFSPTGAAPTVDTTNPFSQSMLLQTHFDAAKRGDTNNLAARGQLYSGALGNQLGLDQTAFDQGTDTLLKSAHSLIDTAIRNHANNIIQFGPGGNAGQAGLDATGAAIGRQKPTDPTAPATGATGAAAGSGAATPAAFPAAAGPTPANLKAFPKPGTALPTGGVVPGKAPKPVVPKPKAYTGKSFVPFGGK